MRPGARLATWVAAWWRGEHPGPFGRALATVLVPAEIAFHGAVKVRNAAYDRRLFRIERAAIPVVSVGNITVGGTGKTPFCAWLARRLQEFGHAPAIVLRGYGEDEIRIHRELNPGVPVIQAPERVRGLDEAVRRGATCAVLDDGFQHRRLWRDLDIVLISAEQWDQTRRMLPRGPYREPVDSLRRADHLLVTRKTSSAEAASGLATRFLEEGYARSAGVVRLTPGGLVPLAGSGGEKVAVAGRTVAALSTLADPTPFFQHLRQMGADVHPLVYPDHHTFSAGDLREIASRAEGKLLVMTRKEAVKLEHLSDGERLSGFVLEQSVVIEGGAAELDAALLGAAGDRR